MNRSDLSERNKGNLIPSDLIEQEELHADGVSYGYDCKLCSLKVKGRASRRIYTSVVTYKNTKNQSGMEKGYVEI